MFFKRLCSVGLTCAVLGLAGRAQAQDPDPWLGTDKGKHFSASAVFAGGGYAASMLLVEEPWQRAAIGGGFAFTLGIGKEVYDATGHGDPSWRDLTWDLIGCAFGVATSLLIDYAFRSPPRSPERARLQPQAAAW
jgi:putative lipoprotein